MSGMFIGKIVYCPKCKRKYENPVISYIDNGKYYCFCYCGNHFEIVIDE